MRADAHKTIKKQENDKEISEDIAKDLETDLQKKVDEVNKRIEEAAKHKEVEVMKV
jgi:ribosome recycling factor